jgi:hypothetical protein
VEAQMTASAAYVAPGRWQYARLEGPGHWIPRDGPRRLGALLLAFLRGGGGGGSGGQRAAAAAAAAVADGAPRPRL